MSWGYRNISRPPCNSLFSPLVAGGFPVSLPGPGRLPPALRFRPCPGPSRRLLTHTPRQATPTYARRARSGGGACYAPGLSRAVLRKATARASPYADAVRRRIALKVSASVIGRRRFHLPRPLLVCRVPCADVRGSGSAPGDACPPCGGCAERTAKTPTVPGARRAVAPFYESGDALHAAGLPRPFGDCGTRHTSTGPPRGRPHFAGRGRLRRPSRPSAFRRPAVALRAVERSPQGGSLQDAAGGPGNAVSPRQVFPPAPPFPGVPPSSKESGRGKTFLGGNSTAAFTARLQWARGPPPRALPRAAALRVAGCHSAALPPLRRRPPLGRARWSGTARGSGCRHRAAPSWCSLRSPA